MKKSSTPQLKKNIYGHAIDQKKPYAGFWADQLLTWNFWKPDWTKKFRMDINIMRTPFKKIQALAKKNLGMTNGFLFEPSAGCVMEVMRPAPVKSNSNN